MRPGDSPGDDDRRLHEGERRIGERLAGQLQSSDQNDNVSARRTEVRHVYAETYQVRGTRGRDRLLLFVRCWLCGLTHQHGAKTTFVTGKRTAACGLGAYVVHLGTVDGEVAA